MFHIQLFCVVWLVYRYCVMDGRGARPVAVTRAVPGGVSGNRWNFLTMAHWRVKCTT